MDIGPFAFEVVADGIASTLTHPVKRTWIRDRETYNEWNPSRWMVRLPHTDTLMGENGKPLSERDADEVHMWRTHNSFSGRCALSKHRSTAAPTDAGSDVRVVENSDVVPRWLSRRTADYMEWRIDLYLRSSAELPNILVSVGPYFYPYTSELGLIDKPRPCVKPFSPIPTTPEERYDFDRRMLQTPLIWEEPCTMSVELNKEGMFLWSEEWEIYGKKLCDRGMLSADQLPRFGEITPLLRRGLEFETLVGLDDLPEYEAYVRLDFKSQSPSDAVPGQRMAEVTVSLGELDPRTGVYESNSSPLPLGGAATAGPEKKTVAAGDNNSGNQSNSYAEGEVSSVSLSASVASSQGSIDPFSTNTRVMPHLFVNWTKVATEKIPISRESHVVHLTPYVTLMAGGDAAVVIGGGVGPEKVSVISGTEKRNAVGGRF